jgi:hypothetical protein
MRILLVVFSVFDGAMGSTSAVGTGWMGKKDSVPEDLAVTHEQICGVELMR